jgi:hypothetical protein
MMPILMRSVVIAVALIVSIGRADIERALDLARWPHTDAERAQFHARYTRKFAVPDALAGIAVDSVEVITELRLMELIGEAHARTNDLFARGGAIQEAEDALRPFRGRVSLIAHVRLGLVTIGTPDVIVAMAGPNAPKAIDTTVTPIYAGKTLVGADVEAVFDAAAIGQTTRVITVTANGVELARAPIDFRVID